MAGAWVVHAGVCAGPYLARRGLYDDGTRLYRLGCEAYVVDIAWGVVDHTKQVNVGACGSAKSGNCGSGPLW